MIGSSDRDRVDIRLVEQFVVIVVAARNFKSFRSFPGALWIRFGDGHCRRAWTGIQAQQMAEANCTCTDYATAEFVSHMEFGVPKVFSANTL